MLGFMTDKRKAVRLGGLAILLLFGGCFLALFVPRFQAGVVVVSFVAYVACTRRAMALCHADDIPFTPKESPNGDEEARKAVRDGLIAGTAGALTLARSFNAIPALDRRSKRRARSEFPRPIEGTR
jgi:hypothetical protein